MSKANRQARKKAKRKLMKGLTANLRGGKMVKK